MAALPIRIITRLNAFVIATLTTTAIFGAAIAPAPAQAGSAVYYTAELAAPTDKERIVAKGTMWMCEGTQCIAAKASSRPLRICRGLQREVGTIVNFNFKGEALAEDRLAKCNA